MGVCGLLLAADPSQNNKRNARGKRIDTAEPRLEGEKHYVIAQGLS